VVKSKRKPIEEILESVAGKKKVLTIGCGGCASVCLAGGQREVNALNAELKLAGNTGEFGGYTVERQCNMALIAELDDIVKDYDCLLSMACGAGAQLLAERYPKIPVFPALNTVSIGVDREIGMYEEKCRACGECVLAYTGGICPVTRCAKGVFNGPCGGTNDKMCEISSEIPCAWFDIYERLKGQDRLDDIKKLQRPMQWQNQVQRTTVQEPYERRYYR
jgi:ferredoxin